MADYGASYRIEAIDGITPFFRRMESWQNKIGRGFNEMDNEIDENARSVDHLTDKFRGLKDSALGLPGRIARGFTAIPRALGPIGTALAGAFSIGAVTMFGNSVVRTLAEFEKYNAVLSTTLGSAEAADAVFRQIQDFASTTPFQINELTDAYVRLANQGFQPSMEAMRQMGDLAAAHGKGFIQLSEAIIDAQVNEFERLKEFGIRAQKSGDTITFTYNKVKTQVDNNAAAIRKYIVSLGNLQKNQGTMNKIAKTSGGLLSNLSDKWTMFQYRLGQANKWLLELAVNIAGKVINKLKLIAVWTEKNKIVLQGYAMQGFHFLSTVVKSVWNVMEGFIGVVINVIHWVTENKKQIIGLVGVMGKLAVILGIVRATMMAYSGVMVLITLYKGITSGAYLAAAAQWALNLAMNANPVGIIITAVGFLLPLLIGLASKFDWIKQGLFKLAKWIFKFSPFGILIDTLKYLIPGFSEWWDGFVDFVLKKINQFLDWISKKINQFASWLGLDFELNLTGKTTEKKDKEGKKKTTGTGTPADIDIGNGKEFSASPSPGKSVAQRLSGVSASGAGGEIKNITINIQNLVRQLMIETDTMDMAPSRIKDEVAKALLSAVNDVNYQ